MDFRVLGPLDVRVNGCPVQLGGVKPRRLLVALLSHANAAVSTVCLGDWLWPNRPPPPSAVAVVQAHVSRLRRVLEPDRARWGSSRLLLTRTPGYLLSVDTDQLDVLRFEHEVARGREQLARGSFAAAAATLTDALSLWRGEALLDIDGVPALHPHVVRWEEIRHFATVMRIEADLELGRHLVVVSELECLTSAHPFDERLHGLLMLALYRCHRRADALLAYERLCVNLRRELDTKPAAAVQRLRHAVIVQDTALETRSPRAWV